MTKEQYLQLCKRPEIPMEIWFEFYKEKGGILDSFDEFVQVFTTLLWNEGILKGSEDNFKRVTFNSALNNFHQYYAQKFGLWI